MTQRLEGAAFWPVLILVSDLKQVGSHNLKAVLQKRIILFAATQKFFVNKPSLSLLLLEFSCPTPKPIIELIILKNQFKTLKRFQQMWFNF